MNGNRFGKVWLSALVLALVSATIAGCGTTSGIVGQGKLQQPQVEAEVPLDRQVFVNNTSLARDIGVTDIKAAFSADILQAAVTIVSKTGSSLNLQYKFVWIDAKGWEINPESGTWRPLVLYGKDAKQLQGVAPNANAKEFKLKIRRD